MKSEVEFIGVNLTVAQNCKNPQSHKLPGLFAKTDVEILRELIVSYDAAS
jgi:hypothetical protein